jgi:hypothetical protein
MGRVLSGVSVACVVLTTGVSGQSLSLDRQRGLMMLDAVRKDLEEH